MKEVTQTKFGYPEGNCFFACLASIFELELSTLEHLMWKDGDTDAAIQWRIRDWLAERGIGWVNVANHANNNWVPPQGYTIMGGISPRPREDGLKPVVLHAVVAKDGVMVWDPHPSREGIVGEALDWDVFFPLRPEMMMVFHALEWYRPIDPEVTK